jgi:hypothetical protein
MQTQTNTSSTVTPAVIPSDVDDALTDLVIGDAAPAPAPAKPKLTKEEKLDAARARNQRRADEKKAREKEAAKAAKEEQAALDAAAKKIKLALAKGADAIVEVGEELHRIKKDHKGRFTKWREENLRLSNGSANNYMNAAKAVGELRGLVATDKHDAINRLPPTILYGWHKLDDDDKQEIATKIEAGEIMKALPRKEKPAPATAAGSGDEGEEGDETAPVSQANDPDTKDAEELARKLAALMEREDCATLRKLSGFKSVRFGEILQSALTARIQV